MKENIVRCMIAVAGFLFGSAFTLNAQEKDMNI